VRRKGGIAVFLVLMFYASTAELSIAAASRDTVLWYNYIDAIGEKLVTRYK
jgi:hypothetical protein